MATKGRQQGEWVGGLGLMPAYVTGEREPYRPEMLLWMSEEGAILGHDVGKPGEMIASAAQSLREAIEHPMVGRAHAPKRVRVASVELAEALRSAHREIEIVCAPTPEIDALLAAMRERMGEDREVEQTYLSAEVDPEKVAAFFRATATLFRAKPWTIVPGDDGIISVTIDSLDVRGAVLSVIGQMRQSFGFILFASLDDYESYLDAADAMEHGEEPILPRQFALNFERGADMSASLRKEIAAHRWEVAGPNAYPWPVAVDADLVARPASAKEMTIAEAISLALPHFLSEKKKVLRAAWYGGAPVERTIRVGTHGGELDVTLRAPCERAIGGSPFDLLAELGALGQDGEEMDEDARRELEDELLNRFADSPEAKAVSDVGACRFIMDFAASYFGATVATLRPPDLREIVFEIIPRKVMIEASEASAIIAEARAFYMFLKREFGLKQADGCLRVLDGDATKKLEAALTDSSKFGMAKSLFAGGREAGFDMSSKEGIEAWMRAMEGRPLPDSFPLSPFALPPSAPRGATRAKKDKRKAVRKARKKNR